MINMLMPPLRQEARSPPTPLRTALRACMGSLGLVFAYSCGYNLLLLAPSIYLLQIYDRVLSSRSIDTLAMLTLVVGAIVVVGGLLDALRRAALGRIGAWLDDRLRPAVLSACLDHASRADGTRALEAYRDLTNLRQFIESGACPMLFDLLWAPLFLAVLFLVHPALGAIGAASAIVMFGLALGGERLTEGPAAESAAALMRSYGQLGEVVQNLPVIRAMGMLEGAAGLVYRDARDARDAHQQAQRRNEIVMLVAKPVRALVQVLIMGCAGWLVLEQGRSPAIIFATTLLFGRTLAPIEGAIAGWRAFATATVVYRRLGSVLSTVNPDGNSTAFVSHKIEGQLNVDNVSFAPAGSNHLVLKDISFRLAPGQCLGIIGPSGSGKSTLGRIIAGISRPTVGSVLLDNIEISSLRDSQSTRHFGYLPQEINLLGETVKDVIARLGQVDPQKVIEAAKLAGLHDTIMRLPRAYDTVVSNGCSDFLRSYRQRLGLARAFFGNPSLVILDEPNASLDYLGERALLESVERAKAAKITVIIITHRLGILSATNKIAILQHGTLTAFGDSKEVFENYVRRPQVGSYAGQNADLSARSPTGRSVEPAMP